MVPDKGGLNLGAIRHVGPIKTVSSYSKDCPLGSAIGLLLKPRSATVSLCPPCRFGAATFGASAPLLERFAPFDSLVTRTADRRALRFGDLNSIRVTSGGRCRVLPWF